MKVGIEKFPFLPVSTRVARVQSRVCASSDAEACTHACKACVQPCLFPQNHLLCLGVSLPSPLLAALEYAPPTLGTWPRFSFPSVSPPKVNLIPGGGVGANSGHVKNDVKPCIGTFENKTPIRRKERLPISGSKAGRIPEREAKKRTTDTMERIPLQLEQQSDQAVCSKAQSIPTQRRMFKTRPHRRLQPQSQPLRP